MVVLCLSVIFVIINIFGLLSIVRPKCPVIRPSLLHVQRGSGTDGNVRGAGPTAAADTSRHGGGYLQPGAHHEGPPHADGAD